jgi:O-antigen ligase
MKRALPSNKLPLFLALLIVPLAVAGQNIGMGVYALILFAQIYARRAGKPWRALWAELKVPVSASVGYIVWGLFSCAMNPANPFAESSDFVWGYLSWALLPPVFFMAQDALSDEAAGKLEKALALVAAVMGAVAIAQLALGFKLEGSHFVPSIKRAQGFYSHPLTFAYVMLLFVPLGWIGVLKRPGNWAAWVIFAGGVAGVFASSSRTVQAMCVLAMVVETLAVARGRGRAIALGVIVVLGLAVGLTDNPMRERFLRTATETNYGGKSDYPDDRLAFWHVHWVMFSERPLIGHGENITTAYRTPYYEKLGLGGLERKFEAHNLYLQILVNTGIVGLALYLTWFGWALRRAWTVSRAVFTALVVYALASLTQNSFQDSEVRYALTLVVSGLFLAPARPPRA